MSEQEKSQFEKELLELMAKHGVRVYYDFDDKTWYFLDSPQWDGNVHFPITDLPSHDNR